jgi:uncharacterized repeat protein (TIGR01451 family)
MSPASRNFKLILSAVALILAVLPASFAHAGSLAEALRAQQGAEVLLPAPVEGPALSEATGAPAGKVRVMVELSEPSAAVAYGNALKDTKGMSMKSAKSLAVAAGQRQMIAVESSQSAFDAALAGLAVRPKELFRVKKSLNGFAMEVDVARLGELQKLPGVKQVIPLYLEYPTNSTSVPFIGAPNVWANTLGLPAGADGTGIKIGVIDTGIDYLHPDFGGPGAAAADYAAEKTDTTNYTTVGTATAGPFPTAKVVGGTDFAGDAYTGANAPVPDANPMDCNGHGSHVSGSAAGFGMTTGGATFAGPYDANASTYSPLLIGPGTAPKALLYGLRVFGCAGSTNLTVQAIDWAVDPNGDNDLSDHLDVINMSLGSNFGSVLNSSSVAADNAALAGVIVVASAGNAGDTFFISGAPGAGSRVIATAASVDSGVAAPFVRINSPGSLGSGYIGGTAAFGPALTPAGTTGDVVLALDAANGAGPLTTDGCDTVFTNAAAVAGKIALIDRGTCGFAVKAKNAQLNGAIGVIIANNAPGSTPPGMAGVDPTITIPTTSITLVDANALKAGLLSGTVNVTLLGPAGSDTLASFSSRGPRRIYGSPIRLKPDIAAPGLNITSVQTGTTCLVAAGCTGVSDPSGIQVGTRTLTISGTSMASPHMAGVMALLKQLHPDWTVEELKALAMNYANHDVTLFAGALPPKFGPSRIGAGRVDPSLSATGSVVAMNADDEGLVSVTFLPEVVGVATQTKKVRIVNKGMTSQTFDLAFDMINDAPGVSFSLPGGSSVTVPAQSAVAIDVLMSADSSQMDEKRDPSLFPTQGVQANYGDQPRNYLTEEMGYLTFKQSSALKLRLPVYMAERPSSNMSAPPTIVTGGAATGSTTIPLSGADVCTGTLAAGPTCTGTFPTDVESLVTPLELQVVSPLDPVNSTDYADIQYAGVGFLPGAGSPSLTSDVIIFGVSSWGDWSTLNDVSYNVCVDNNNDGVYDKIVYNANPAIFVANASNNDNFVRIVRDTVTNGNTILGTGNFVNGVGPNVVNSALHLNNVMFFMTTPSQLGYTSTAVTTMKYKIITCPGNSGCARTTTGDRCTPAAGTFFDQAAGPYTWNWAAQGLNFGGNFLDEDLNGNALPVTWNTANMTANGSVGALLLHHHNGTGKRAEVVLLDTAQSADLAIAKSVSNPSPALGTNVVFTVTVTNNGPNAATGVVVSDFLPTGLTWVSDDSAGAYAPGTGLWTVGALANAASATLHITATVDLSGQICNLAMITAGTPLDPNPANNQSTVCVNAPRSGEVQLTMSASTPTALVGASISYTLTLKNNGADTSYAVNVQEAFPAFPLLNPTTFSASSGTYNPATGLWNIASLGNGSTQTLTITLLAPNMAGALTDQASATATTSDPNNANNTASATINILSPAAITATKTAGGSFNVGGTVTYTVVLSNSAAFDQQDNPGNEFTDVLPSQLTLVSANATSGTALATVATNSVTWNGVVPAGGSVTVTITATINAGTALQTVSNQGSFLFDADGNGTNESAGVTDNPAVGGATDTTSFVVTSAATIGAATKTVSGNTAAGGTVTYTITIPNTSASAQLDNPGNEFTDVLPAQLTLVSATATSGTAVATIGTNTVTWNGSIAASSSVTITITARIVTGTAVGATITNQGSISYDADGNGTNEATALTDDPAVVGAANPTTFAVTYAIPALSPFMLLMLGLALSMVAFVALRRMNG